jgi:hypothetical protein
LAKPLSLSSDQQDIIIRAAAVLPAADQNEFHTLVHEQLEAAPELGDGLVFRACKLAQRTLFKPPQGLEHREPRLLKRFG